MLVLTRKLMEKLFIGDDICVTVVRLEGGQVRLGIDAPREVSVVRAELVPERPAPRLRSIPLSRPGPPANRTSGIHHPRLVEPIADAADGFDELAGVAELLPQALDVDVDRPLQHDRVLADGGVHQLEARERAAGLADQDLEQAELGRRQRQLLVAIERPVAVPVDHDPLALDQRSRRPARPSAAGGAAPS